jgi:hypothetical protein
MIVCLLASSSCGQHPPNPVSVAQLARNDARMGYSVGAVTLDALARIQRSWVQSLATPTPADETLMDDELAMLDAAKDALQHAKPFLEDGADASQAKAQVVIALRTLSTLAAHLRGHGLKAPDDVLQGLDAALVALGAAS